MVDDIPLGLIEAIDYLLDRNQNSKCYLVGANELFSNQLEPNLVHGWVHLILNGLILMIQVHDHLAGIAVFQ